METNTRQGGVHGEARGRSIQVIPTSVAGWWRTKDQPCVLCPHAAYGIVLKSETYFMALEAAVRKKGNTFVVSYSSSIRSRTPLSRHSSFRDKTTQDHAHDCKLARGARGCLLGEREQTMQLLRRAGGGAGSGCGKQLGNSIAATLLHHHHYHRRRGLKTQPAERPPPKKKRILPLGFHQAKRQQTAAATTRKQSASSNNASAPWRTPILSIRHPRVPSPLSTCWGVAAAPRRSSSRCSGVGLPQSPPLRLRVPQFRAVYLLHRRRLRRC